MESVDLRTSSYSFVGCMGLAKRVIFNATACCVVVAKLVVCRLPFFSYTDKKSP